MYRSQGAFDKLRPRSDNFSHVLALAKASHVSSFASCRVQEGQRQQQGSLLSPSAGRLPAQPQEDCSGMPRAYISGPGAGPAGLADPPESPQ